MRQIFEYHPVIGYRYIPNIKARIPHENGGYLIKVNETGFRANIPFIMNKTPSKLRILLFGDSYTAGDSVPNHLRYSDILETKLRNVEVYNYGLPSTGTDQQYLVWQEFARGVEHDLVIIAVYVENIRRIVARCRPRRDELGRERIYAKPFFLLNQGKLLLQQVPPSPEPLDEHQMYTSYQRKSNKRDWFSSLRYAAISIGAKSIVQNMYQPVPEYDSIDSPAWMLMRAILSQWVSEINKPVVIMPIPIDLHIDELSSAIPYQSRFKELSDDIGCVIHDPLKDMQKYSLKERRLFRWDKDFHFTPKGNEVVASSLAPVVEHLLTGKC